jgi:hypothetical protein
VKWSDITTPIGVNYRPLGRRILRRLRRIVGSMTDILENSRSEALRKAQDRADELFRLVETKGLIRPGMTESQLSEGIYKLAQKLRDDIGKAFAEGKEYFKQHPDITAAELYGHAQEHAAKYGWEFGGPIAGHLVGQFPHERIPGDKITLYLHPQNPNRMRNLGVDGQPRHWILEIHFVDRARKIGGFYEQFLTVD